MTLKLVQFRDLDFEDNESMYFKLKNNTLADGFLMNYSYAMEGDIYEVTAERCDPPEIETKSKHYNKN